MKIDEKKNDLTKEEILDILAKRKASIKVFNNYNVTLKEDKYLSIPTLDKSSSETKSFCFCKKSGGNEVKTEMCPYCGSGVYSPRTKIESKEYAKQIEPDRKKYSSKYSKFDPEWTYGSQKLVESGFYVKTHPDFSYGILIKRFEIAVSYAKNELNITSSCKYLIEIIPGERNCAKKKTKSGFVDCDIFEALNISSNTVRYDTPLLFDGANNLLSFMDINKDFTKRTAFKEVFYNFNEKIAPNSFFMLYMYFYAQYPVVELLAKMNYTTLINSSLQRLAGGYSKENIKKIASELSKVFNPYSTTGHLSLCIPKYIGDFLNAVDAPLSSYEFWSDVYAYDPISKENFQKLINNKYFEYFFEYEAIANLLKYGYKVNKLIDYLTKNVSDNLSLRDNVNYLEDYHRMLELMHIEKRDMYPSNIKEIHDKLAAAYRLEKDKITNEKITEVAKELEKCIPESEEFAIICPKTTNDFVEEGNRQHNCVASYAHRVANGDCAVFFIRKKEDISQNYITAEYRYGKLYQIRYKNNRSVTAENEIDFAKKFCEKLSKTSRFKSI